MAVAGRTDGRTDARVREREREEDIGRGWRRKARRRWLREEVEKLELEEEGGRWLGCERRARTVRYNCVPRMCRFGGGRGGEGEERRWSKDGVGRRGSWGFG